MLKFETFISFHEKILGQCHKMFTKTNVTILQTDQENSCFLWHCLYEVLFDLEDTGCSSGFLSHSCKFPVDKAGMVIGWLQSTGQARRKLRIELFSDILLKVKP